MRGPFKESSNPSTISSPVSWNCGQMSALPQPFLGDSAGRGTVGRRGAGAWDAARPWKPSAARETRQSRTDAQAAPGKAELALPSGSGPGEPCRASPAVVLRASSPGPQQCLRWCRARAGHGTRPPHQGSSAIHGTLGSISCPGTTLSFHLAEGGFNYYYYCYF